MNSDLTFHPLTPRTAHLVGICGSGMKALAELLHDCGWTLSGSDSSPRTDLVQWFGGLGMNVHSGHSPTNLPHSAEVLVYSPAVAETNPERDAASRRQLPQWSYVDVVAALTRKHRTLCIAGTHGKSTTTAMIACILDEAGWKPSVLCGAESLVDGRSGRGGMSEWLVLESCEYRSHFLEYCPASAVVTGIEPDHFDCFPKGDAIDAYRQFVANVPLEGFVAAPIELRGKSQLWNSCAARIVPYWAPGRSAEGGPGAESEPGWSANDLSPTGRVMRFRAHYNGNDCGEFRLQVPGIHNVRNALAAVAASHALGVSLQHIRRGLDSFGGLKRRFEVRTIRGTPFVDDYAHHPTAVRYLLKTARDVFCGRRLVCAFQPHQLSRTLTLLNEFAAAFELAGEVLVLPVYPAREQWSAEHLSASQDLVRLLLAAGKPARLVDGLDHLARTLETSVASTDVVLTIGAGDIDRLYHELA